MRKDSREITVVAAVLRLFYAAAQTKTNNSGIADKPIVNQPKLQPVNYTETIDTSP